jgi:hypothetical protein
VPAGRLEVVVFVGRKGSAGKGSIQGSTTPLSGSPTGSTYRKHATSSFLIINTEDILHPAAPFYLHGTGTGSDGSQLRLTSRGHFVLGKRTGEVRRNTNIITCRES